MAGAGGRSSERSTSRAEAAGCKRRRQRWEVDFARYFATPRRAPSEAPPPGLRYISRGRRLHPGTWLPAASPAALSISRPTHSFDARVLTVSIGDVVYEEHYVSILNFSWPQVACVTECPVRGSRVVFMSFCDRSKQIQKFAVRFRHLSDAESFLNSVKGLSSNAMDIIPSGSDYMYECEDSSSSEYIASDGLQYRPDEAASFEEPTSDHRTDAPAVDYHKEPDQPVLQPPIATNINSIYSGFPDGYSGMLTDCSVKIEKDGEEFFPATTTDHAPEKAYMLDICHDAAGKKTIADKGKGKDIDASDETYDILAGIQQTNVANDSFHGRNRDDGEGESRGVGHKANYQQCHETKCVFPGCLIYMNVILQFRNVHGVAKVEHVPGCALNQLAVLRSGSGEYSGCRCCDRAGVTHQCGAVSTVLPSEADVSARGDSLLVPVPAEEMGDHAAPASRRKRVVASPIRPCILLQAGELSDDSEYSQASRKRRLLASPLRPCVFRACLAARVKNPRENNPDRESEESRVKHRDIIPDLRTSGK